MKLVRVLTLAVAVIFFAASCSKDKHVEPNNPASIVGKWKVSSILTVEPNEDQYAYTGQESDFVEFKKDGTMSSSVDGYERTVEYDILDDTHVDVDGSVTEIKELTNNKLVMLDPHHDGQPEDITYTLSK